MQYHRPESLKEALKLLQNSQLLGGGTTLTPVRHQLGTVLDLQELDLGGFTLQNDAIQFGAGLRLQAIIDASGSFPPHFIQAVRHETALNMRNAATLAGLVVSADGRSPLLTVLAAMDAKVKLEPAGEQLDLAVFFKRRSERTEPFLITEIETCNPGRLSYEMVARSPMDRPIVCSCAALRPDGRIGLALGGFGEHPRSLPTAERGADLEEISQAASAAYAQAGDAYASAEYRSAVAAILVKRVMEEVLA
ncbi:MAG: FAD binding domain-containing protein [Anaerolineales bacterium]|jgi:CO/xanthine dehydrogenase FAD-binding subunit